jgi:hypothetical protein
MSDGSRLRGGRAWYRRGSEPVGEAQRIVSVEELVARYFWLFFVGAWVLASLLISLAGGWAQLSHDFRTRDEPRGPRWRFQSARLRFGVGYNGVLTFAVDPMGLWISIFPLFRVGHPPLFIPWREMTATRERAMRSEVLKLRFQRHPSITLTIRGSLARKMEAALGRPLPVAGGSTPAAIR